MFYIVWTIYFIWVLSLISLIIIYIKNIKLKMFNNNFTKIIPIVSEFISLFSLISFSYVFIFNRGSNVAQLSESFHLWAFWYTVYTPLFFLNLFNIVILILSIIFHKKIYNNKNKIYYLILVINIILNIFHIILNFPDA